MLGCGRNRVPLGLPPDGNRQTLETFAERQYCFYTGNLRGREVTTLPRGIRTRGNYGYWLFK